MIEPVILRTDRATSYEIRLQVAAAMAAAAKIHPQTVRVNMQDWAEWADVSRPTLYAAQETVAAIITRHIPFEKGRPATLERLREWLIQEAEKNGYHRSEVIAAMEMRWRSQLLK